MSITVELDLPQADVERAKAEGLLQSEVLSGLVRRELERRKARVIFGATLAQMRSAGGDEMTPEEVQAEIDAARAQRNMREGGHSRLSYQEITCRNGTAAQD